MKQLENLLIKELGLTNDLNDEAKKVRREYYKIWRDNNKDKIRRYNSKYWEKRAEKIKNNSNTNK